MTELDEELETLTGLPSDALEVGRRKPRSETRIDQETAFVLHAFPYRETSMIVDVLTRHHGRIGLVARGARRPRSALRGLLLAFRPLGLSWVFGRSRGVSASSGGDLGTLMRAEWLGGQKPLAGEGLMSGFYLNELVQKLLARGDPHELLFDRYVETLAALADDVAPGPVLRRFEIALLQEAGYALRLDHDARGAAIDARSHYRYVPEQGAVRVDAGDDATTSGKTLLDMHADDYADPATLAQAKLLMRQVLQHHLAGQVLHTRRLVIDLQTLEGKPR